MYDTPEVCNVFDKLVDYCLWIKTIPPLRLTYVLALTGVWSQCTTWWANVPSKYVGSCQHEQRRRLWHRAHPAALKCCVRAFVRSCLRVCVCVLIPPILEASLHLSVQQVKWVHTRRGWVVTQKKEGQTQNFFFCYYCPPPTFFFCGSPCLLYIVHHLIAKRGVIISSSIFSFSRRSLSFFASVNKRREKKAKSISFMPHDTNLHIYVHTT